MTQDNVSVLLENQGIDKYGLWPAQRQYLQILAAKPQKACTLERLTLGIGMDATMVRQEYEPYLIEQEFIEISNRGRAITEKGKALATEYTAIERAADEAAEKEEEGC
jgi:Holliday junction resolvasome RuvABC ATP-dependent DNA helicase subunit